MKAMILAAGLGTRMAPLTDTLPKPLLQAGGQPLIVWLLQALLRAGVRDIVINHFYRGEQIEALLGDGSACGANIQYSRERLRMETAGGIIQALPLLGDDSFMVVNADIWTDFDFTNLAQLDPEQTLGHLVMVPNAQHHPQGDFVLDEAGLLHPRDSAQAQTLTFSGISVLHPRLFAGCPREPAPLLPILLRAMAAGALRGELYRGQWWDIGTPQRLAKLDALLRGAEKS